MPALDFGAIASEEEKSLAGKVALVVGASRGLGAAISACLAAKGAQVLGLSRSKIVWADGLPDEVARRISIQAADASDAEALSRLSAQLRERFGRLDFLVCNAFPAIPSLRLEENAAEKIDLLLPVLLTWYWRRSARFCRCCRKARVARSLSRPRRWRNPFAIGPTTWRQRTQSKV